MCRGRGRLSCLSLEMAARGNRVVYTSSTWVDFGKLYLLCGLLCIILIHIVGCHHIVMQVLMRNILCLLSVGPDVVISNLIDAYAVGFAGAVESAGG